MKNLLQSPNLMVNVKSVLLKIKKIRMPTANHFIQHHTRDPRSEGKKMVLLESETYRAISKNEQKRINSNFIY